MTMFGYNVLGFGAGGTALGPTASFITVLAETTDGSSFTYSSTSFGDAADDRYIVVVSSGSGTTSASKTLNSTTIGGVTATSLATIKPDSEPHYVENISIAAVPSGTSGDIVLAYSSAMSSAAIGVYRLTGIDSTVHDTATALSNPASTTIDVPANGILIMGASTLSNPTCTLVGVDEQYDQAREGDPGDYVHAGGFKFYDTVQSGLTISSTWAPGSGNKHLLAAASFAPAE